MNNTLEPKELSAAFRKVASIAEDMKGHLLFQAKEAAAAGETSWLVTVSNDARDIEDFLGKLENVRGRLHEILTDTLGFQDEISDQPALASLTPIEKNQVEARISSPMKFRRIRVSVTQGQINQNLLTLTAAVKRGRVAVGEQFIIHLPDGTDFQTDLVQPGNKLRERGLIREFYQQEKIVEGDFLLLEEIQSGVWTLTKDTTATPPSNPSA